MKKIEKGRIIIVLLIIIFIAATITGVMMGKKYQQQKKHKEELNKVESFLIKDTFKWNETDFPFYDKDKKTIKIKFNKDNTYKCYDEETTKGKWELFNNGKEISLSGNEKNNCKGKYEIVTEASALLNNEEDSEYGSYYYQSKKKFVKYIEDTLNNLAEEEKEEDNFQVDEKYKDFCIDEAKKKVKSELKSPSSAKFSEIKVYNAHSKYCQVGGKVEAKNSYGVKIVNQFMFTEDEHGKEEVSIY